MSYHIDISPEAVAHLRAFSKRDQTILLDALERQLVHRPDQITRNRKPMRSNQIATWELRVGDHRIYYDIDRSG